MFSDAPMPSTLRFAAPQEAKSARFSFYTPDEIRNLSVGQVTSAVSLDGLGHPLSGGLHDLRFGAVTREHGSCLTCGLGSAQCPGHMGHIELAVPVYNPIVFPQLYRLLGTVCFGCKRFRHSAHDLRVLRVQLLLLEAGMLTEAMDLPNKLMARGSMGAPGANKKSSDEEDEGIPDPARMDALLILCESTAQDKLDRVETETTAQNNYNKRNSRKRRIPLSTHARAFYRELMAEFYSKAPGSCRKGDCKQHKSTLRKDGYSKIFVKHKSGVATSAKVGVKQNKSNKKRGDDNEEEGSDVEMELEEDDEDWNKEKFLHAMEVQALLATVWKNEGLFCARVWGGKAGKVATDGYLAFFLQTIAVPPPRFRPSSKMGSMVFEHPQNVALVKCIKLDQDLRRSYSEAEQQNKAARAKNQGGSDDDDSSEVSEEKLASETLTQAMNTWVDLQEAVNGFLDSAKVKGANAGLSPGVRQSLEKKEGLFRQNMMGKRVNYAARSVISPDPYIATNEVGLPVIFARKLSYPEPVTAFNAADLAAMVRNGPNVFPGAHFVEDEDGRMINLSKQNERRREELADQLLDTHGGVNLGELAVVRASRFMPSEDNGLFRKEQNKSLAPLTLRKQRKVWRHTLSGDVMLANRQPTLHKSSLMAHKVRVINNETMQTIRMHYANCNSYNADFDGDEINLHLPQSELCRAEAFELAFTDTQYISSTNGAPLRGLIQDHVGMGVMLTKQNTFLTKEEYTQMLYMACGSMLSGSGSAGTASGGSDIRLLPPAVLKPRKLWTGKQVISSIIMHLVGSSDPLELLTMGPAKTKIPAQAWKIFPERDPATLSEGQKRALEVIGDEAGVMGQCQVVVRQGILCTGVLDKAQFGASAYGLVHCIYELYGPTAAGELLSGFGRLFTFCAQKWGHTCAISDLLLNREAETLRTKVITNSVATGVKLSAEFAELDPASADSHEKVARGLERRLRVNGSASDEALLDSAMQGVTSKVTSEIIEECLPKGQYKPFPSNAFSLMIFSGAKGSLVNHSQIACGLGQQSLEGRRVPRTVAGKSLPCFSPFDPTPRAGGFVSDRFLTGVRPQEYYFHCMAGREGLIDTAVKTANSGYLQRCLIKHLENVSVGYDRTVRLSDGGVLQFLYGGDGLDAVATGFLSGSPETLSFLYANVSALVGSLKVGDGPGELRLEEGRSNHSLQVGEAARLHNVIKKTIAKSAKLATQLKDDSVVALFTGSEVKCRRPVRINKQSSAASSMAESALLPGMHAATLLKTDKATNSVDVRFHGDGIVLKGLPINGERSVNVVGVVPDPVVSSLSPDTHFGAVGEALQNKLTKYVATNPHGLLNDEDDARTLQELVWIKYLRSLAAPGENVGVLAAQSIGEPSTQMTLNTFHLAGHGAANVTLGIPRLRELLMTASQTPKTPSMLLPCLPHMSKEECAQLKASMYRLKLSELLRFSMGGITVVETMRRVDETDGMALSTRKAARMSKMDTGKGSWQREYNVQLALQPLAIIEAEFGLDLETLIKRVSKTFFGILCAKIDKEIKHNTGKSAKRSVLGKGSECVNDIADDNEDAKQKKKTKTKSKLVEDEAEESEEKSTKNRYKEAKERGDAEGEEEQDEEFGENGENSTLRLGRKDEMDYGDDEDEDNDTDVTDAETEHQESKTSRSNQHLGTTTDDNEKEEEEDVLPPGKVSAIVNGRRLTKIEAGFMDLYHFWHGATYFDEGGVGISKGKNSKNAPAQINVRLRMNASAKKLLMVGFAEAAAEEAIICCVPDITASYIVEGKGNNKETSIQTDGCNLAAAWELADQIDVNRIYSNDIGAILRTYGVEAAREAIVREVKGVFGVYGIVISERHLQITADYMCYEGGYKPLNRIGMATCSSPLVRMTFETSAAFLTAAALEGEEDALDSVSARLCLGQLMQNGTGAFDVLAPNPSTTTDNKKNKKKNK